MKSNINSIVEERRASIRASGAGGVPIRCESDSVAGCVSQRACVYCGARVVLNPITDAIHLVHGPIGCASYTWDIRGSLSSGSDLYRSSFSTDLREEDIIFGGERKLERAIDELVTRHKPPIVIVYSTCIVGIIGDDLQAVCKRSSSRHGIPVVPVESSGFAGNKSDGYRAACELILKIVHAGPACPESERHGINYLGDFNLAGEAWIISSYLQKAGIELGCVLTGDSSYESITNAGKARFNMVQCAGSMGYLAKRMQETLGIPYLNVSFLGLEDTTRSLRAISGLLGGPDTVERMEDVIAAERARYEPLIESYRSGLAGKKAAIYVGGGFKAISLIKQFAELGMEVVMVGTQTGRPEEYQEIDRLVNETAVVLDDANPSELERFMIEQGADLLVGGVKERPLAYKLGLAFIDHNHDRKHPLSGFVGALNFAREVRSTLGSPVWQYLRHPIPGPGPAVESPSRTGDGVLKQDSILAACGMMQNHSQDRVFQVDTEGGGLNV